MLVSNCSSQIYYGATANNLAASLLPACRRSTIKENMCEVPSHWPSAWSDPVTQHDAILQLTGRLEGEDATIFFQIDGSTRVHSFALLGQHAHCWDAANDDVYVTRRLSSKFRHGRRTNGTTGDAVDTEIVDAIQQDIRTLDAIAEGSLLVLLFLAACGACIGVACVSMSKRRAPRLLVEHAAQNGPGAVQDGNEPICRA